VNKRKKAKNSRELLGLESVSLMLKKSGLNWSGYIRHKDDTEWIKRCMTLLELAS